jgi:uncharacterized protein YjbI with pentapeptide repeats
MLFKLLAIALSPFIQSNLNNTTLDNTTLDNTTLDNTTLDNTTLDNTTSSIMRHDFVQPNFLL